MMKTETEVRDVLRGLRISRDGVVRLGDLASAIVFERYITILEWFLNEGTGFTKVADFAHLVSKSAAGIKVPGVDAPEGSGGPVQ